LNKDGLETTLETEYKAKPPNGEWDAKVEVKCGGYELGPVKGWSELQVDFSKSFDKESKKLANSQELTFSQSLNHTDYFFGMKVVSDVPKVNVSCASAALLWKNGVYDFWARGSFIRKVLGAGATYRLDKQNTFSNEFIYDMKLDGKNTGIMGSPLFWRFGYTAKTANIVHEYRMMAANNHLGCTWKGVMPIDKSTKLTVNFQEELTSWMK